MTRRAAVADPNAPFRQLDLPLFAPDEPAAAAPVAAALAIPEPAPRLAVPAAPPAPALRLGEALSPMLFRHPRASREIDLGRAVVAYEFQRARRRSIGMVVSAEGLSVRAPRWVGRGEIEAALLEKAAWIQAKLVEQHERARKHAASRIEWRDGASLPFLGETVILVLDPRATGAVLDSDAAALPGVPRLTLHVGLPHTATAEQIRDVVQAWLHRQARRIFEERCAHFAPRLNVSVRRLGLSSAQTRWGSASADGSVRLNWRLVHFAMPTIDYVVAHELAHLREMNHSPRFWDVVRSVIPDLDTARGALRHESVPAFD
ncbi:M48 family metallopeptidase [Methylibium sp.]|uniref:M48 family metallopeptidase n=1 Tax=Methylibium sp. TaxID=2067992 RepID=UPI003D0FF1E7